MERIVRDGKSSLLLQLADRIGNVVKEEERGSGVVSENVVAMTRIGQEINEAGLKNNAHTLIVKNDEDLGGMDVAIEVIRVMNGVCNDPDIEGWNLSDCSSRLRELVLGNDCLQYVKKMKLVGFASLEKAEFGMRCLCKSEGGEFEVSECKRLKSVKMGDGCCEDWNSFTLKNCGVAEVSIGDGCFVNCESVVFESESSVIR